MDNYKYICEMCKFKCNYNSAWLDHLSSEKHKRYGKPKIHKCKFDNCEHETSVSWNMKMHVMTNYSTKEERSFNKKFKFLFYPLLLNIIVMIATKYFMIPI